MKKLLLGLLFITNIATAQEFDFNCLTPHDLDYYVEQFMADAQRYGHDFSDQRGIVEFVDLSRFNANGASLGSCRDGYHVQIDPARWESGYNDFGERWRKRLIYHELGHALLERDHVCAYSHDRNWYEGDTHIFVWNDIMTSGTTCREEYPEGGYSNYVPDLVYAYRSHSYLSDHAMEVTIERLFTNTDQAQLPYLNCDYSSKNNEPHIFICQ